MSEGLIYIDTNKKISMLFYWWKTNTFKCLPNGFFQISSKLTTGLFWVFTDKTKCRGLYYLL